MKRIAGLLIGLALAAPAIAQEVNLNDIPESAGGKAKVEATDPSPHPAISTDSSWAAEVVIVIAGMFVAAMLIGPFVRLPVAPVEAHGHDDHGHGGGHGHDDHAHDAPAHGH